MSGTTFSRSLLAIGAVVMALAVAMSAVAAHAVKWAAHPDAEHLLHVALLYHLVHGLGMIAEGTLARIAPSKLLAAAGALHLAGVILFSGALYVTGFTGASLGFAAPLGGIAFIAGWLVLAAYALRKR